LLDEVLAVDRRVLGDLLRGARHQAELLNERDGVPRSTTVSSSVKSSGG